MADEQLPTSFPFCDKRADFGVFFGTEVDPEADTVVKFIDWGEGSFGSIRTCGGRRASTDEALQMFNHPL